jgi:hypothetical protein
MPAARFFILKERRYYENRNKTHFADIAHGDDGRGICS